jgi:hypothetical protein
MWDAFYRNIGTVNSPLFYSDNVRTVWFIYSTSSSLSFVDIDADGDVDAFGNHAVFFQNMGVEQVVFQHTVIVASILV